MTFQISYIYSLGSNLREKLSKMVYDPAVTIRKVIADATLSGGVAFGVAVLTWFQGADLSSLHIPLWAIPVASAATTGVLNFLKNINKQ